MPRKATASINPTFQLFLNHSDGGYKRRKMMMSCALILVITVIISILIFVAVEVLWWTGNFDGKLEFKSAHEDNVLLLLGGESRGSNIDSIDSLGLNQCQRIPEQLFIPFHTKYDRRISSVTSNGSGTLVSCIEMGQNIYCKTYEPYKKKWMPEQYVGAVPGKLQQDFIGYSIGSYLVLRLSTGFTFGYKEYDPQIKPIDYPYKANALFGSCHVVLDDKFVVQTGGYKLDTPGKVENTALLLSFTVSQVKFGLEKIFRPMMVARKLHGCSLALIAGQNAVIVAGGSNGIGNYLDSVEFMALGPNFDEKNWTELGKLVRPRSYFPTVGVLNSTLIVAGGSFGQANNGSVVFPKSDNFFAEVFNTTTLNFQPKSSSPKITFVERYNHATVSVQEQWCKMKNFFFRGSNN